MTSASRHLLLKSLFLIAVGPVSVNGDTAPAGNEPKHETLTLRGRVCYLADSLQRLHGVRTVAEAAERQLVLETKEGEIHPLVEDVRGRAFRVDERLRKMDVELSVRRYRGTPVVQIIQVFALRDDGKYELDYWCDVCAIVMFEQKLCDCCQAPNRLRERKVEKTAK